MLALGQSSAENALLFFFFIVSLYTVKAQPLWNTTKPIINKPGSFKSDQYHVYDP